MKNEEWRDVAGYKGLYQVSDQGRVKSLERVTIIKDGRKLPVKERILKPNVVHGGYLIVCLYAGGKRKMLKVHRLVCQAFHDNPENKPCVNHIDENKTNNAANNLEWCTYAENNSHGTHNARMAEGVAKALSKRVWQYTLDGELIKIWPSTIEAQRQTGFSSASISQAANGKSKQAHGYRWEYVEREERNNG